MSSECLDGCDLFIRASICCEPAALTACRQCFDILRCMREMIYQSDHTSAEMAIFGRFSQDLLMRRVEGRMEDGRSSLELEFLLFFFF